MLQFSSKIEKLPNVKEPEYRQVQANFTPHRSQVSMTGDFIGDSILFYSSSVPRRQQRTKAEGIT
jgi:hypothetical protein